MKMKKLSESKSISTQPTMNVDARNSLSQIVTEPKNKFGYDDLLADLLTHIYLIFLLSNAKYEDEYEYICRTVSKTRGALYIEINPW